MAKKAETKFKEKILPILRKLPYSYFEKIQQMTIHGTPDLVGVIRGRAIYLELKRSSKEARSTRDGALLQKHILAKLRKAGAYAEIVCPENWPKVHEELSRIAMGPFLL